ncbi:hypothetical protein C0995_000603 [Termitomyces sp. Mi166|nr:hypothetical protein C0995_000603 [Termitomyces sp. Mi166\
MHQDRESEHAASTPGLSVAPRPSIKPGTPAHHGSELAPSDAVESRNNPVEASSPNSLTHDHPTSTPSAPNSGGTIAFVPVASDHGPVEVSPMSPINDQPTSTPSVPNSGGAAAFALVASDQGPSSLPASGSNDNPTRSIRRKPIPQTSLGLEEGDPECRRGLPLPPLPPEVRVRHNRIGLESPLSPGPRSGIDYIVPVNQRITQEKTARERLQPTLLTAIAERDKYAFKAKITGYSLNIAIGLQIILGALTTGLASVASISHQTAVATAVLGLDLIEPLRGGLSTITASYLARARGSSEPELSITKVKDLEQLIRQCEAFQMDHGKTLGDQYDKELEDFRNRLEDLLRNSDG